MAIAATLAMACGPRHTMSGSLHGEAACARADSFFATTLPRPATMSGRATFDVDSYRVRGHFRLELAASGDAVLEFSGSTLLGGHREDAVISLSSDTLRVLDRERGRYYEGEEVARLIASGTGKQGEWALALRRVLASGCPGMETVVDGEEGLSGTGPDGPFTLRVENGGLAQATWSSWKPYCPRGAGASAWRRTRRQKNREPAVGGPV